MEYLSRLLTEKTELEEKMVKLDNFLRDVKESGSNLTDVQVENLNKQLVIMRQYAEILTVRYEYDTTLLKTK